MTTEERKSFDDFKRELLENPTFGLNFFWKHGQGRT